MHTCTCTPWGPNTKFSQAALKFLLCACIEKSFDPASRERNLSTLRREKSLHPYLRREISRPCVEKLPQESLHPASRVLHPASEFSTLRREFSTLRREATIFVTNGVPYAPRGMNIVIVCTCAITMLRCKIFPVYKASKQPSEVVNSAMQVKKLKIRSRFFIVFVVIFTTQL